nr:immunoglobulin heavy chain junction region [Mus musculus]
CARSGGYDAFAYW